MTEPIEFFFDVVSPFGWFSAERVGGLPRSHARTVAWRPLLLGVTVTQAMGLPPLQTPAGTKNLNASVLVMKSAKDAA
jgi:2-hydroxychromene-2-carboxylate isomerase